MAFSLFLAETVSSHMARSQGVGGLSHLLDIFRAYKLVILALVLLVPVIRLGILFLGALRRTAVRQACPECGSGDVRKSHNRSGFLDLFAGRLRCYPFRCRVCRHRFYARPQELPLSRTVPPELLRR